MRFICSSVCLFRKKKKIKHLPETRHNAANTICLIFTTIKINRYYFPYFTKHDQNEAQRANGAAMSYLSGFEAHVLFLFVLFYLNKHITKFKHPYSIKRNSSTRIITNDSIYSKFLFCFLEMTL